jgi:N6-adenosine-specific RNA methylase IME4
MTKPPHNHYRVILADPPWQFATYSAKGKGRSAEAHYDCMSYEQLGALPVNEWAASDCVLLMWVTDPMLAHGLDLMGLWGFTYKTVGFYWAKTNVYTEGYIGPLDRAFPIGTGYWTRANPEQCLLATRGHPKRINADVRKLIVSPRREHSRKPDEIYERIERLCAGPYLELFARQRREGWDSLGNEVDTGAAIRRWGSKGGPQS